MAHFLNPAKLVPGKVVVAARGKASANCTTTIVGGGGFAA